jgi:hypothetical protein
LMRPGCATSRKRSVIVGEAVEVDQIARRRSECAMARKGAIPTHRPPRPVHACHEAVREAPVRPDLGPVPGATFLCGVVTQALDGEPTASPMQTTRERVPIRACCA